MSHRLALTLAVALTLLFAVGVVAGRDRLLGVPTADPAPPVVPTATAAVGVAGRDRVIEVTVPAGALSGGALVGDVGAGIDQVVAPAFAADDGFARDGESGRDRRDDRRGDDHGDDDHGDDHEDDHDD